jgi:hypothetical protein
LIPTAFVFDQEILRREPLSNVRAGLTLGNGELLNAAEAAGSVAHD